MKANQILNVLILLVILSLMSSVSLIAASEQTKPMIVKKVDAIIDNIHPSLLSKEITSGVPRLFCTLYIHLEDFQETYSQIKEAGVYDSFDTYWPIDLKKDVNPNYGFLRLVFFNSKLSESGSLLSIKDLTVYLKLKDEQVIEYPFSIPEPGAAAPTKMDFVYAESYHGKMQTTYIPALKLGSIRFARFEDKKTINLDFMVNDKRVFNGRIVFYDKNMKYLGESRPFVTSFSKEILSTLNKGTAFNVNNQINRLILSESQIQFTKGGKMSKIKYAGLWLSDGAQFTNSDNPDNYNYASHSEIYEIK